MRANVLASLSLRTSSRGPNAVLWCSSLLCFLAATGMPRAPGVHYEWKGHLAWSAFVEEDGPPETAQLFHGDKRLRRGMLVRMSAGLRHSATASRTASSSTVTHRPSRITIFPPTITWRTLHRSRRARAPPRGSALRQAEAALVDEDHVGGEPGPSVPSSSERPIAAAPPVVAIASASRLVTQRSKPSLWINAASLSCVQTTWLSDAVGPRHRARRGLLP